MARRSFWSGRAHHAPVTVRGMPGRDARIYLVRFQLWLTREWLEDGKGYRYRGTYAGRIDLCIEKRRGRYERFTETNSGLRHGSIETLAREAINRLSEKKLEEDQAGE